MAFERSWTVRMLRAIKAGQSFNFYKGDIPPLDKNSASPLHDALIRYIFAIARELEMNGDILLKRSLVNATVPEMDGKKMTGNFYEVPVPCYRATGLK